MKNKLKSITINDNEKFLRQISVPVDILNDNNLSKNIAVLDSFCRENDFMAMAAVQLGIPKRIIYLKNTNLEIIRKMQVNLQSEDERKYNESRILINPVIINRIGLTEYWEACASCLDNTGLVERPYKIEVEYYDEEKTKHREVFEGFPATVLCHEIDHLDGILHIDIALEIKKMNKDKRREFRKTHPYEIVRKDGEYIRSNR